MFYGIKEVGRFVPLVRGAVIGGKRQASNRPDDEEEGAACVASSRERTGLGGRWRVSTARGRLGRAVQHVVGIARYKDKAGGY